MLGLWGDFDELFDAAFTDSKMEHNFMTDSNIKVMYFNLLYKYKTVRYECDNLKGSNVRLKRELDDLTRKFETLQTSSDVVSGHIYRQLKSKYRELSKDYDRVLEANVKLSDELTYLKSLQEEQSEEDIS